MCEISSANLDGDTYKFTVDVFIKAAAMQNKKNIVILDQNGTKCLTLSDQVDWIAQTILTNEPDNALAKQLLVYIQKIYNFTNNVQTVLPSEPGTETEIGGKVEI
jgi:hypothetical protein